MKIESIVITNFRQFHTEQEVNFSTDSAKNVTVIHGENGSGKTSLLNAFKWCFYGLTDFDTTNENILNEAAIQDTKDGGFVDIRIIVKFNHEKEIYTVKRQQTFQKESGMKASEYGDHKFSLDVLQKDGQTKRNITPHQTLQAILPKDMQPYFFFNGERIEKLAGVNESEQIQDAIRKLMGLELVDRAEGHLKKIKRDYRSQVKESVSGEQKTLHELIEKYEAEVDGLKASIKRAKERGATAVHTLKSIDSELKQHEEPRKLQDRRNSLNTEITNSNAEIEKINTKQKSLINNGAFLVISESLFQDCGAVVEEYRNRGVLPYRIRDLYIDDLIEKGTCICGNKIEKGSREHGYLKEERKKSGSSDLDDAYTMVSALLKNHQENVDSYKASYKEEARSLKKYFDINEGARHQLDEVSAQLVKIDDDHIAKLERQYIDEVKIRDTAQQDEFGYTRDLEESKNILAEKKKELSHLEDRLSKQNFARKRLEKTELMIEAVENLKEAFSVQVREELSKKVDATFQSIIRKPVRAIIDEKYRLRVLKKAADGEEYPVYEQSTAEMQITSLSFISSIIALAKERHTVEHKYFRGGLYPLVMDSPFGSLDPDYRKKVAAGVSELAEQVIMFVSSSQWAGGVKQACENKVGKSYQLIYHSPKVNKSQEDEYTKASENSFEYSTFKEV